MVIPGRQLGPAMVIVVLAALAGCASGGSSSAAAGTASTVAASAVTSAPASAASAPTPTAVASRPSGEQASSALLVSAITAMLARQSVHLGCTTHSSSGGSVDSIDVGVASGRIATTEGDVSITTMLADGIAYVSINTAGVWVSEGVPQAEADKLAAGKWLSIGPGQSYGNRDLSYTNAIKAMSIAGQADNLRLTGPLKSTGATTAQGVPVYGVSGDAPSSAGQAATESVYIAATGAPLPVNLTAHASGGTITCDFGGWDEPLRLTAPTNVVPITAIPE